MANETFDLVVIGSGPGGYVAAIRAAQLGLKVAVVEKRATFGGTCLNVGCIPSKALLQSSHLFEQAGHDLGQHGIVLAPPKLDFAQMMKRKGEVVEATTKGVAFLFRKNKIASFQGTGRIDKAGSVSVMGEDGAAKDTLATKSILIASGYIAGEALVGLITAWLNYRYGKLPAIFADPSYAVGLVVMLLLALVMVKVPLNNAGSPDEPAPPTAMM